MSKLYEGIHKTEDGWQLLGSAGVYDGVNWMVHKQDQKGDWSKVKVVANGWAYNKANYPMSWNGTRFAKCISFQTMAEHRSDLLEGLTAFMKKITDNVD